MRFLNSIRFSVWEHTIGWLDLFGIGDRGDPWNCCLFQDWMVNGPMPNPFSATLNDSQGLPGVYPASPPHSGKEHSGSFPSYKVKNGEIGCGVVVRI